MIYSVTDHFQLTGDAHIAECLRSWEEEQTHTHTHTNTHTHFAGHYCNGGGLKKCNVPLDLGAYTLCSTALDLGGTHRAPHHWRCR